MKKNTNALMLILMMFVILVTVFISFATAKNVSLNGKSCVLVNVFLIPKHGSSEVERGIDTRRTRVQIPPPLGPERNVLLR